MAVHRGLSLTFNREEIIAKIEENRIQHMADYKEAMGGYYLELEERAEQTIKEAQKVIQEAKKGNVKHPYISGLNISKPEHHDDDYARALSMLAMSVVDMIVLGEDLFDQYILDQWGWKQQFTTTNLLYSGKS